MLTIAGMKKIAEEERKNKNEMKNSVLCLKGATESCDVELSVHEEGVWLGGNRLLLEKHCLAAAKYIIAAAELTPEQVFPFFDIREQENALRLEIVRLNDLLASERKRAARFIEQKDAEIAAPKKQSLGPESFEVCECVAQELVRPADDKIDEGWRIVGEVRYSRRRILAIEDCPFCHGHGIVRRVEKPKTPDQAPAACKVCGCVEKENRAGTLCDETRAECGLVYHTGKRLMAATDCPVCNGTRVFIPSKNRPWESDNG